jgi:hypothetical protein
MQPRSPRALRLALPGAAIEAGKQQDPTQFADRALFRLGAGSNRLRLVSRQPDGHLLRSHQASGHDSPPVNTRGKVALPESEEQRT